jgi:hypothetical protein
MKRDREYSIDFLVYLFQCTSENDLDSDFILSLMYFTFLRVTTEDGLQNIKITEPITN